MAAINSTAAYQELLSVSLEDRSGSYQDIISDACVLFHEMRKRGGWETFSGPNIRETLLYDESGTYIRYSGYDTLVPAPKELFNDAVYSPKMGAVSVTMSNEEILKNSGENQIFNIFKAKVNAAEQEIQDRFTEDAHSAGSLSNQIGGLQAMIPTTVTNDYGSISRNTVAAWKTKVVDANSITIAGTAISAITAASIKPLANYVVIRSSRGKRGPNLWLASEGNFLCYSAATEAIQRVTNDHMSSELGFTSLKYYGGGRSMDVVLEGGIGTAMPSNISYFVNMDNIKFRYHPERNFDLIGGRRTPVNQDAVVQHVGFMGELTLDNPIYQTKLLDSA
jgi:hypothetical protein